MISYLYVYSENRYVVYKSVVLKNDGLGAVDIIFTNKLQFFIFSAKLSQVHG